MWNALASDWPLARKTIHLAEIVLRGRIHA
jgi:hypothetical protein